MADRSHLTPVTTTDKRGRTTTVYRSLDHQKKPGSASTLPPVALSSATAEGSEVSQGSPLREPSARTLAEIKEFLGGAEERWPGFRSIKVLRLAEGREAAALAMDFVEDGALDEVSAQGLLVEGQPWDGTALSIDALRTAAVFFPRAAEFTTSDSHWAYRVLRAVGGYRISSRGWDSEPITTQEQLDTCAALTGFTLRFAKDPDHWGLIRGNAHRGRGGIRKEYEIIANKHLDQLLRERPHDLERIIAYVNEHGMDPTDYEAVHLLRAWLEGGIAAPMRSGWL
ncbi:hypothetical protein ACX801_07855 [Arthrobacter bambusae]